MASTTLRPNGNPSSASWTLTGAASITAALSDNSDASYATCPAGAWNGTSFVVDFGTVALPSLAQVRSVTPRVRVTAPSSGLYPNVTTGGWTDSVALTSGGPTTYTLPSRTAKTDGTAWVQADIDAIQMSINAGASEQWFELYIDVVYNEAPVVTVTTPTGTVTATTSPTVTWTYTDPEGDVQERCRVKIFSAAQYGAGGFDPETSTPTYDSGELFTSSTSLTVSPLADATAYRAYVKISDAGSSGRYSAWAFSAFSIALAQGPPAQPIVTAAADNPNARVLLTVQGLDNLMATNQASLETDTTGWAAASNCTIARSTAQFLQGAASLAITSSAAGTAAAATPSGVSGVPVIGNKSYTALASFRAATVGRTCQMYLAWYTSAGALISTSTIVNVTDATTGWTQAYLTVTSPANAAFVQMTVQPTATAAAGEVHYLDGIEIAPASPNLMTVNQASLETDTTGWAAAGNSTIARSTAQSLVGSASLAITSVAAGTAAAATPSGTAGIPVTAGQQYTLLASFRAATVARNVQVYLSWYNAGGGSISQDLSASNVPDTTTGWTRASVTAVAPVGAAFLQVVVQPLSTGAAGEVHYVDAVAVVAGSSTAWSPGFGWNRGGVASAPSTALVEYSDDGGVTWSTVRGASALAFDSAMDQIATVYDYESPPNTARLYRATTKANIGGTLSSIASGSVSATVAPGSWWLKDPTTPARNIQIYPIVPLRMAKDEVQAVLRPLGRSNELVVADKVVGEHLTLELPFTTTAQSTAFELLRNSQRVLLLQSNGTDQWYGRIGPRRSATILPTNDLSWRQASIEFVQTDTI